ncbi:MAG: hypothetical protein ACK501_19960 [Planctomycetota bacterium]|jgi:hypothetical protein
MVRAPATAATLTFKVALAGRPTTQAWQANAPAGITQFAQITAAAHVVTVQVVAAPDTRFGIDAPLLPLPIPNVPSLRLVTLFAQGAIAAPGANALGLAFSGGLAIRIPRSVRGGAAVADCGASTVPGTRASLCALRSSSRRPA